MRTLVTFQANAFNDVVNLTANPLLESFHNKDDEPPGFLLAQFVMANLAKAGFVMKEPENRSDYAWSLYLIDSHQRYLEIICGYVGDNKIQWLIQLEIHIPFFKKLFGGKAAANQYLQKCCCALHKILAQDERFDEIRWHTSKEYNRHPELGKETPVPNFSL